ncbi:CDAN1-interacting nuclease 1-like [Ylistrum balloti]|uniref:CDAN1-interacting nuclease 1-like n=1 Tax=Ylistrum balloti TaxID=509963 RepID=UPI002905EF1B|nr:CDAN1-interacting nuclease 1-like [Ylistrum balloti]
MKLAVYNEIVDLMRKYKTRDEALRHIAPRYPDVSVGALGSIFAQDYQKKMRKTHHLHYSPDTTEYYYDKYKDGVDSGQKHVIMTIARNIDLSPSLLSRMILERHLSRTKYGGDNPPRSQVTQMMKDTTLIENPVLANEIYECVLSDDQYGPLVDKIKHSIGHEYEFKLNRTLDSLKLSYIGEDQMRAKGYDKTPDVKLEVPIAVDGHMVNWIESKASFGDEYSHRSYLKDQFWSYWNRFGPGMVIYWFGFIDELDSNTEKGIILRDSFPESIVRLNPVVKLK